FEREVAAGGENHPVGVQCEGRDFDGVSPRYHDLERLIDMRLPWPPGGVNPAPVIQPEGDIARLLDLIEEYPAADRMDRSGRHDQTVAGGDRASLEQRLE